MNDTLAKKKKKSPDILNLGSQLYKIGNTFQDTQRLRKT